MRKNDKLYRQMHERNERERRKKRTKQHWSPDATRPDENPYLRGDIEPEIDK